MKPQPGLRDVQLWMVAAITGMPVDTVGSNRFVKQGPRLSAQEHLDIYRSAYRARLVECLTEDYHVLASTLGHDRFDTLAQAYIARHPSSSSNLNGYGRHMPTFCMESSADDLGLVPRFASELSALEWSIVEVIHAQTARPLDVAELQAAPPERWAVARFVPSAAVRLHRFEYPVNRHYQAALDAAREIRVPLPKSSTTLVYRSDVTVWRMDLTPLMAAVLSPLLAGETIGRALLEVETTIAGTVELEELSRGLRVWFREWASAGLFARIEWG